MKRILMSYLKQISCLIIWFGVSAQQAMKMGKVVRCYLSADSIQFVPGLPIVNVNKFTLFDTLDSLIHDRALLHELGDASEDFIEVIIAQRWLQGNYCLLTKVTNHENCVEMFKEPCYYVL